MIGSATFAQRDVESEKTQQESVLFLELSAQKPHKPPVFDV